VHAPAVPVFAGDVSFRMTDFASRNAERAGVAHAIEFKTADALQRMPPRGQRHADAEPALWRAHRAQGRAGPGAWRARGFEGGGTKFGGLLRRAGGALEAPLHPAGPAWCSAPR
jgi:putative N6-adenine-specific DNA methylase